MTVRLKRVFREILSCTPSLRLPVLRRCCAILLGEAFAERGGVVEADQFSHFLYGVLLGPDQFGGFFSDGSHGPAPGHCNRRIA